MKNDVLGYIIYVRNLANTYIEYDESLSTFIEELKEIFFKVKKVEKNEELNLLIDQANDLSYVLDNKIREILECKE